MGKGSSGISRNRAAAPPPAPVDPIVDPDFDVTKQKPTKANFVDNMNEAQLLKEIEKEDRRAASAEREADARLNSASAKRMFDTFDAFPGGVGGSAVNAAYHRMVDRGMNQVVKSVDARERANDHSKKAERYRRAYDDVKGTGLLVHEARTARAAANGNLAGKWTRTDSAFVDSTFGKIKGQKNGDFTVGYAWASYYVHMNGREIGKFDKAADAKKLIEKYAGRNR